MQNQILDSLFFDRYSAAENTFFVGNAFNLDFAKAFKGLSQEEKRQIVRKLCLGFVGQKTDGCFIIKAPQKSTSDYQFEWEFFNSDGSDAEMCGNAARCAISAFSGPKKNIGEVFSFLSVAGVIKGKMLSEIESEIEMTKVVDLKEMTIQGHSGFYVNTGVPHFVVQESPDRITAKSLRFASEFGNAGANITFLEDILPSQIKNFPSLHKESVHELSRAKAVTYERGVEDFTRACGTGAVAAAVVVNFLNKAKNLQSKVEIQMPGGQLAVVGAFESNKPILIGGVEFEYRISHFIRGEL